MKNLSVIIILFVLFISLFSCAIYPPSATRGTRTLILDGETFSEDSVGKFTSWYCKDYRKGGATLVEVGYISVHDSVISRLSESTEISELLKDYELPDVSSLLEHAGFILYDGGYSGELTIYRRTGLEHRWDWGPDNNYAFVIKQNGIGYYYDFSMESETTANEIYKCYKR